MSILFLILLSFPLSQEVEYIDTLKIKNPNIAWKMSLIPGLGQVYNKQYGKAIFFIGTQSFSISQYKRYESLNNVSLRNTYAWWIVGLFFWNILDAYVDAQISTFPSKTLESNYVLDTLAVKNN